MVQTILPLVDAAALEPIVEELAPHLDPWAAFRRVARLPHAAFLDSAMAYATLGRYSFVTADPFAWLRGRGDNGDVLATLQRWLTTCSMAPLPGLPPFQGGALGLFGYDLCHEFEWLPRPRWDEFQVPDVAVGLYDWVIAFDHLENRCWFISTGLPEISPRTRRQRASKRLKDVRALVHGDLAPPRQLPKSRVRKLSPQWPLAEFDGVTTNMHRPAYLDNIRRAIEYIHAGDCFQVNVAQRLLHAAPESPLALYERLRTRNPAPFACYLDLGDFVIASASPERFLRMEDREIETRPIKGTRPRGAVPEEDDANKRDLLASAKDRAENVMIVDLLRNDLGRVCEYGSVRVPAVCQLETYRFVHHLVSVVRGRLRADKNALDILRAAFPGGSVTGAPKIRAMEIIAELEPTARGAYCGCAGYLGFNGSMDTNILIRTFTIGRGWAQFPVGGGIVADSRPECEHEETLHKAEGLLRALRP